jgi:hypothetical protein
MEFSRRTLSGTQLEAGDRPVALRIARGTRKSHPETRLCQVIMPHGGLGSILRHSEVRTSVFVKVSNGRSALFTINSNARFGTGHGSEMSPAVPAKPKAPASVGARPFRTGGKEILRKE